MLIHTGYVGIASSTAVEDQKLKTMHLRILALKLLEALKQILYAVRQRAQRYLTRTTNLFACALTNMDHSSYGF